MLNSFVLTPKPNATLKAKKLKLMTSVKVDSIMEPMPQPRLNEVFSSILNELSDFMAKKNEHFRSKAYSNAAFEILKHPTPIYTMNDIKQIKTIGATILSKFEEYITTGKVQALESERNDPMNLFTNIYGVGPAKAKELVCLGIKTIEQLKAYEPIEELLNSKQVIGLTYYDDILQKIPRSEILEFEAMFREKLMSIDSDAEFQIVGSFRRGLPVSSDIDIIITNKNNQPKCFTTILESLIKDGTITEVLSKGNVKCLTLVKIKPTMPMRRIDFLYSPPKEYPFALLYFTGSKLFNTLVRQTANELGFTLNEHGLSHIKDKIKGELLTQEFLTEEAILHFLKIEYVAPEHRTGATSLPKLNEMPVPLPVASKKTFQLLTKSPKNKTLKKPKDTFSIETELANFKQTGISLLQMLTEEQLAAMIDFANNKYYCEENPVLTDSEYDIIHEYFLEKYPTNELAVNAGHTTCSLSITKNKVKLPYELWSMDKIKPTTNALHKWTDTYKGPFVISTKLDGISALYVNDNTGSKLFTRGNGVFGQDISHLIPYLFKKEYKNTAMRGEIILTKENFNMYYKTFANARNFVSGVVNKKTIDPAILSHIDFVAYELIEPSRTPSEQMKHFESIGIKHVDFQCMTTISNEIASDALLKWRKDYPYEIDGIIIMNDAIYPRPKKNPEYAFAFKMVMSEQVAEAKVVDVLWTPSKDGYIKPRVQIEKITLSGVTIEYATGFNAKFIEENKIGIGAIITIIRSGDVIPHIVNVVVPAEYVKFPEVKYLWNETHVDIILEDKETNSIVQEKNIVLFFQHLEVTGIGPGTIKRIVASGFNSVPKILAMKESDFLSVTGVKEKTAKKLYENIQSQVTASSLVKLMVASNIFGRGLGEITFTKILNAIPEILTSTENNSIKKIKLLNVEGVATTTADKFILHIPEFLTFIQDAKLQDKLKILSVDLSSVDLSVDLSVDDSSIKSHELYNKQIVLTNFRDKEVIETIKKYGGVLTNSVTKNTFAVIVKETIEEETTKTKMARNLNIPILTRTMFEEKFK